MKILTKAARQHMLGFNRVSGLTSGVIGNHAKRQRQAYEALARLHAQPSAPKYRTARQRSQ